MTERVTIDEYTYVADGGHVQILRNGLPWLGQEPGGFLRVNAWIAAASIIDELRTKVAELETARTAIPDRDAIEAAVRAGVMDAARSELAGERPQLTPVDAITNGVLALLDKTQATVITAATEIAPGLVRSVTLDRNGLTEHYGPASTLTRGLEAVVDAGGTHSGRRPTPVPTPAPREVEAAARAINPQAWSVYDRAQAIDPNDPANIDLVQHTLVTARLALDAATKAAGGAATHG